MQKLPKQSHRGVITKKNLKISQNALEITYAGDCFNKVAGFRQENSNFNKKKLQQRCFPVNFSQVLRTPLLLSTCELLLLKISVQCIIFKCIGFKNSFEKIFCYLFDQKQQSTVNNYLKKDIRKKDSWRKVFLQSKQIK